MIGKTVRFGTSFLGALEYCYYVVQPNRSLNRSAVRGELLYFQHVAPGLLTSTAEDQTAGNPRLAILDLARQFQQIARLNDRVEKPVWHQVFSFPIGEAPGQATMALIAQDFALAFELTNNPLIAFRHAEKDHDHFHIVASRVDNNGRNSALSRYNYARIGQFCRQMEERYHLTPTAPMLTLEAANQVPESTNDTHREGGRVTADQRSLPPAHPNVTRRERMHLRQAIDQAVNQAGSLAEFCQKLSADSPYSVQLVSYTNREGQHQMGIVYVPSGDSAGRPVPGYALGRDYVYGKLIQRIDKAHQRSALLSLADKDITTSTTEKSPLNEKPVHLPFGGTASAHKAAIERDIAQIQRSLQQLVKSLPTEQKTGPVKQKSRKKSTPRPGL